MLATAATDLWQQALARWCDRAATDWARVGRWVARLARGVTVHRTITARFVTITTHAIFGLGLALGVDPWRIAITP